MGQTATFTAQRGDKHDDEGFRIVTGATTMYAHLHQQAALWLPGGEFASSMSVLVRPDGTVTISRDGKGDTLSFGFAEAAFGYAVPVTMTNGRIVAYLTLHGDREHGVFVHAADRGRVTSFDGLVEGLIRLGSAYLV